MNLSTQPYKGTQDFYPPDKQRQAYMFGIIRETVKKFGYEEYDAPLIEPLELYLAKSGEEIVNEQTYAFTDRGGRKVAIRPEMTPSVSRMVAGKRQELTYPLRWFSIPALWRYERPQRGRMREHRQLNVDVFGISNQYAELELIMIADSILKSFGANMSMYTIKVSHRGLLDRIFLEYLGLNLNQSRRLAKLIDKKNKIDHSTFLDQADAILDPKQLESGAVEKLLSLLSTKDLAKLPKELSDSQYSQELRDLIRSCNDQGLTNVEFDPALIRGFDYYSGIVFELFDNSPDNNRSMMGGGRYDGLVGLFGVEPVPTAGFGLGDATLSNFLELHHLLPDLVPETKLYLVVVGNVYDAAMQVATSLRSKGLYVAVDLTGRKLGQQLKTAQKKNINYVLIVGKDELDTQVFTLRNLKQSTEDKCKLADVSRILSQQ